MVWDLTDFDGVYLTASDKALSRKLAFPHFTEVLALPEGPLVFPLKAEYNRLNYTFEGRREHLERAERAIDDLAGLDGDLPVLPDDPELDDACPHALDDDDGSLGDHAVDIKHRRVSSTDDKGDSTGGRAVTGNNPRASDDDEAARVLPPGAMFDNMGLMCKLDVVGRMYEVDVDGVRVTKKRYY